VVLRYRYDVVMINLSRSFPHIKYKALQAMAKDFYRHFGEIVAEAIWFSGSNYKRLYDSGIVTVTNPEDFNELFLSTPSMTVLSTHCGNWELLGGFLGYRTADGVKVELEEEQIRVVYKQLSSPVADEVFKRNRAAAMVIDGTACEIESMHILRHAVSNRDKRKVYIFPTDQHPYTKAAKHSIGEFLHQETSAMFGGVGLACRLSHSVMYLKMKRVERGHYEMTLIPICRNASEVPEAELMRKYYDLLEEEINETPANWLWTHKRWK
jgi:KDO2-lipid IV(A) lauroyltransferase